MIRHIGVGLSHGAGPGTEPVSEAIAGFAAVYRPYTLGAGEPTARAVVFGGFFLKRRRADWIGLLLLLWWYDVLLDGPSAVSLVYETDGLLYRTASADFGGTWSEPALIDTTGFNSMPVLAKAGEGSLALWFKRGDDSATWQAADTARFSTEQPARGTKMASIIAGYKQGAIVGIATGVDLLIAKTELLKVRSSYLYEYNMEEDAYIEALVWADRMGADIVSTSLGYRSWYAENQFDGKTAPISTHRRARRRGRCTWCWAC